MYCTLLANDKMIKIYEELIKQSEKDLENTKQKFKFYVADKGDVAKSNANLNSRKANLENLKVQKQEIIKQLSYLLPDLNDKDVAILSDNFESILNTLTSCYVDNNIDNYTLYTDYNAGFVDSAAGATKAATYYSDGANIVCTVAGSVGDGVDSKAKELKKLSIQVDADKDASQSGYILTSILKNTDVPVKEIIKHYKNGTMDKVKGKAISYSLSSGATGITNLSEIEKSITTDGKETFENIKAKLKEIEKKISDGTIKVTNSQAGEKIDTSKLTNLKMANAQ